MTGPEAVRGVVFDMDGVLVDSGAHHRAAWRALLAELGVTPSEREFWRLTIGRPVDEALPVLLGRALAPAESRAYSRRKTDLYHALATGRFQPVPGAVEFVRRLSALGVPRAVATSASRRSAGVVLADLGLREHLPVVLTADDVERGKPDPEVYVTAAECLGLAPAACVVFEDSLVGVRAGRAAGMRCVGVMTAHTEAELREAGAERVIPDFEDMAWPL